MVSSALATGGVRRFSSAPSSRPAIASIGSSTVAGSPISTVAYPGVSRLTQIVSGSPAGILEHQHTPRSNLLSPRVVPPRQFSTGKREAPPVHTTRVHSPGSPFWNSVSPPVVHPQLAAPGSARGRRPGWARGAGSPPGSPMVALPLKSGTPPRSPTICLNSLPKTSATSGDVGQSAHSLALCFDSRPPVSNAISADARYTPQAPLSRFHSPPRVTSTTSCETEQQPFCAGSTSSALCFSTPPKVSSDMRQPSNSPILYLTSPPGANGVASDETRQSSLPSASSTIHPSPVSGETGGTSGVAQGSTHFNFSYVQVSSGGAQELEVAEARMEFAKLRSAMKDQLAAWSRLELSVADMCTRFGPSRLRVRSISIDDRGEESEKPSNLDLKALTDRVNIQYEQLSQVLVRCAHY